MSLTSVHDTLRQRLAATTLADGKSLHVLLQIHVQILEDEVELVAVGVDDVEEAHDVRVVHFLEKRDLTNGSGRDTFIFGFEADLLEGDNALIGSAQVEGFVNNTVRACEGSGVSEVQEVQEDLLQCHTLADLLHLLVVLHGECFVSERGSEV